jgi:hypothetical protein
MDTSGKPHKGWVRLPNAMRACSLTGCALSRNREPAAAEEEFSGDRDELLPPMNGQSGISAGVETLRDGGVAPTYKVP